MPNDPSTNAEIRKLLDEWEHRARINVDSHNWTERLFERLNALLAVGSISALVALGILAASVNLTTENGRVLVLGLSTFSGLCSVLLTVRDYGRRAAEHRLAARRQGALRREIEAARLLDDEAACDAVERIRARWDDASDRSPNVPSRYRRKAKRARPRGSGS